MDQMEWRPPGVVVAAYDGRHKGSIVMTAVIVKR
jgi:hypothetical protein